MAYDATLGYDPATNPRTRGWLMGNTTAAPTSSMTHDQGVVTTNGQVTGQEYANTGASPPATTPGGIDFGMPGPAPAPTPAPTSNSPPPAFVPGPTGMIPTGWPAPPPPAPQSTTIGADGRPVMNLAAMQDPERWNVTGDQTVATQLERILAKDSPLMQQARARALSRQNANGTQNSSMAIGAAQGAVMDRALPIATSDAGTYARAGEFNAGQGNQFRSDANTFGRQQEMANFNLGANEWAAGQTYNRGQAAANADLGRSEQVANANLGRSEQSANANFGRNEQTANADLQRQLTLNQQTTTTSNAETRNRAFISGIDKARSDYANALANISASKDMDSGLKKETLTNLRTTYNTVIRGYAQQLGWDANSWLILDDSVPSGTAAASPPVAGGGSEPSGSYNLSNIAMGTV